MYVIPNDGTNEKIINDTGDYLVPTVNEEMGINGLILYKGCATFHREIRLEIRNSSARSAIMIGLTDLDGVIIDGVQYDVLSVTPVGDWGVGDTEAIQVWTYQIELVM